MPLYLYKCPSCETEVEAFYHISEIDNVRHMCEKCNIEMFRPPVCPRVNNKITWELYSPKERGMIKDLKEAQELRKTADRNSKMSESEKRDLKREANKIQGPRGPVKGV